MGNAMQTPVSRVSIVSAIACTVLITAGLMLWFTAPEDAASFGWYAYAPQSDLPVSAMALVLHGRRLAAVGLGLLALIIAAMATALSWGQRAGRSKPSRGPDPFSPPPAP